VFRWHSVEAGNAITVVSYKVKLLDVRENGSEGKDLLPIETHFDEDGFTQTRVD